MFYVWFIPLVLILVFLVVWAFASRASGGSGERESGEVLKRGPDE